MNPPTSVGELLQGFSEHRPCKYRAEYMEVPPAGVTYLLRPGLLVVLRYTEYMQDSDKLAANQSNQRKCILPQES
jgi:hypothetical protein